nr:hypothetical protein [uncultured Devosia sp.]
MDLGKIIQTGPVEQGVEIQSLLYFPGGAALGTHDITGQQSRQKNLSAARDEKILL